MSHLGVLPVVPSPLQYLREGAEPPGFPESGSHFKRLICSGMARLCSCWIFLFFASRAFAASPDFHIERVPVANGAELITVFARFPGAAPAQNTELPLLSVLRDTLGSDDPEHDRLRYVWVLTSSRPTLIQRAAGALPFFYWRPENAHGADRTPAPVLDLGAPEHRVVTGMASEFTQLLALDPEGAIIRSSTRSYRNNLDAYRRLHILEGLAAVTQLEDDPTAAAYFTHQELIELETRLMLAGSMLGGLVSSSDLDSAYYKERARMEETRGHNWELLRQRAESNGLYFEPFGADASSTYALLWIAAEDAGSNRKFDGQFLGISDPFGDPRLKEWTGYREVRDGKEMIPLALYALDYPKVPLLVVDFRDTHRPKRREMIRHAATDTISGVLGISKFSNMPLLFGSLAFNFVRTRHGAANDRDARLQAYAEVREWLTLDQTIDPELRRVLQQRMEIMGVNPMEQSIEGEARMAQREYAALLRYAADPRGLPVRVARDRESELFADRHGVAARIGFGLAHTATFGLVKHPAENEAELAAQLDETRRVGRELALLDAVAKTPQPEVVWNMDEVRRALDDVASARLPARSAKLVAQIMSRTHDEQTRVLCARALGGYPSPDVLGGGQGGGQQ